LKSNPLSLDKWAKDYKEAQQPHLKKTEERQYEIVEGEVPLGWVVNMPNGSILLDPLVVARYKKELLEQQGNKVVVVKYKTGHAAWPLKKL